MQSVGETRIFQRNISVFLTLNRNVSKGSRALGEPLVDSWAILGNFLLSAFANCTVSINVYSLSHFTKHYTEQKKVQNFNGT